MVEEPDLDAGIGEPLGDEHVVLAERIELELLREADLVVGRAGRVVAARGHAGIEVAVWLEMHRPSVLDQALLAKPRLGHDAPALGPRGDEVELVPGPGEALHDRRAVRAGTARRTRAGRAPRTRRRRRRDRRRSSCREAVEHAGQRVAPVAAGIDDRCADLPLAVLGLREYREQRPALGVADVAAHRDAQLGAAYADLRRTSPRCPELHLDAVEEVAHRLGRRPVPLPQRLAQGDEVRELAQYGDAAVR